MRGYVDSSDCRSERWTEDLSFCFGEADMLRHESVEGSFASGGGCDITYSFLNILADMRLPNSTVRNGDAHAFLSSYRGLVRRLDCRWLHGGVANMRTLRVLPWRGKFATCNAAGRPAPTTRAHDGITTRKHSFNTRKRRENACGSRIIKQ